MNIHKVLLLQFYLLLVEQLTSKLSLANVPKKLKFDLKEHPSPNTVVGNLYSVLRLKDNIRGATVVSGDPTFKDLFRIDRSSGDLLTMGQSKTLLDREKICTNLLKDCFIDLLIYINNNLLINAQIKLTDINDNAPEFKGMNEQEVYIDETTDDTIFPVYITLKDAIDPDTGSSANIVYSMNPIQPDIVPFKMKRKETPPILVVVDDLDYEDTKLYKLNLTACDMEKSCSSQLVNIHVSNKNDNKPAFDSELYTATIKEVAHSGFSIKKLNANDLDEGDYGRLKYSFQPTENEDKAVEEYFQIDQATGQVRLSKQLPKPGVYSLRVIAEDGYYSNYTRISSKEPHFKAECWLNVTAVDTNDNAPEIVLRPIKSQPYLYNLIDFDDSLLLLEEGNKASLNVAYLTITDRDEGENAQVSCEIIQELPHSMTNAFDLNLANKIDAHSRVYKIVANHPLDAEYLHNTKSMSSVESDYRKVGIAGIVTLNVKCTDNGTPAKTTMKKVRIGIVDKDEYPKQFTKNGNYDAVLAENTHIGTVILQLNVLDQDVAPRTVFELIPTGNNTDALIKVDADNGRVMVSGSFDYEKKKEFKYNILAYEKGLDKNSSLNAKGQLFIKIHDSNDNKPVITYPGIDDSSQIKVDVKKYGVPVDGIRVVNVSENNKKQENILKMKAEDADSGKNGQVRFFIQKVQLDYNQPNAASNSFPNVVNKNSYFSLTADGQLMIHEKLDRELTKSFTLLVAVSDMGKPSLTTYTLLQINVQDENDEKPVWRFPRKGDDTLSIDRETQLDSTISRIKAIDNDSYGPNSFLKYKLVNGTDMIDIRKYFTLTEVSGELKLTHTVKNILQDKFAILLQVCDQGEPKYCTYSELKIVLVKNKNSLAISSKNAPNYSILWSRGTQNLVTLAGGILAGLILTVTLIVTLLLVVCKKRDIKSKQLGDKATEETYKVNLSSNSPLNGNTSPNLPHSAWIPMQQSTSNLVYPTNSVLQWSHDTGTLNRPYAYSPTHMSTPNGVAGSSHYVKQGGNNDPSSSVRFTCCTPSNSLPLACDTKSQHSSGSPAPIAMNVEQAPLTAVHTTASFLPQEYMYFQSPQYYTSSDDKAFSLQPVAMTQAELFEGSHPME